MCVCVCVCVCVHRCNETRLTPASKNISPQTESESESEYAPIVTICR